MKSIRILLKTATSTPSIECGGQNQNKACQHHKARQHLTIINQWFCCSMGCNLASSVGSVTLRIRLPSNSSIKGMMFGWPTPEAASFQGSIQHWTLTMTRSTGNSRLIRWQNTTSQLYGNIFWNILVKSS